MRLRYRQVSQTASPTLAVRMRLVVAWAAIKYR